MTELEKIAKWNPPIWHKDFGDSKKELELLKNVCKSILNEEKGVNYTFELDCFEEGYMSVEVKKDESLFLTIEVTDISINKIGLFFEDGKEYYTSSDNLLDIESILV